MVVLRHSGGILQKIIVIAVVIVAPIFILQGWRLFSIVEDGGSGGSATAKQSSSSITAAASNSSSPSRSPSRFSSSSRSTSSTSFRTKLRNDLRSRLFITSGNAISNIDSVFPDLELLCSAAPGLVGCTKSRKVVELHGQQKHQSSNENISVADKIRQLPHRRVASGCCCSWNPLIRSCTSGPFNSSNIPMMRRLVQSHFVHSPTSKQLPGMSVAARACPVFDRGTWNLPDNFIDLDFDRAAEASAKASAAGGETTHEDVESEKQHRRYIGPLLVWKIARELRSLRSVRVKVVEQQKNESAASSSLFSNKTSHYNAPGMLVIGGDSIVRQVFARLIHSIRSRECSDDNEQFRGGVFERYFHISAGYLVTTRGDALLLDWAGCEKIAGEPAISSVIDGGRVLLRICYVWDNTADASINSFGTEYAIRHLSEKTAVSAVVYWPTMHHCNYAGGHCGSANVSNAAVMTVFASALRYNIPRVLTATNIMRHWYPFYAFDVISERNEQLRNFFRTDMWSSVRSKLDAGILRWWRLRGKQQQQQEQEHAHHDVETTPEQVESQIYSAMGEHGLLSAGARIRLYDFAVRHAQLEPRQCDNGHSMCMFWPLRLGPKNRAPVNGLSGVCPNGSRCEDPWNFVILHEVLTLLFA